MASRSEKLLAEALAKARKLHPDQQMYMQTVTFAECQTIENERQRFKDIIKSKDLVYWTRFCILSRLAAKQFFGPVYFSHVCDLVFINALRSFDTSKGPDKLLNLIVSSYQVFKQSGFLPNIQDLIDNQKTNYRTKMRKHVEDVFPPKLLQSAAELIIGFSSNKEKEEIRCQVVVASVMLSGSLLRAMDMLLEGKNFLGKWQVPKEWTTPECLPLEFEEYLKSKWRTELGSLVLLMPLNKISWWNYKQSAPEQFDCYAKQLVRVPNVDWEPLKKLPVLKFLLHDNPVSFVETLKKLHKGKVAELAKAVSDVGVNRLVFNFYELMMPPVLSATFHKSQPPPVQKLAVSSWFATRCCLMEDVGPKLGALLSNSDPSLSKKQHLLQVKQSLAGWVAPKDLCEADLIKSSAEFIENTHVLWQFSVNFTLRQQWLAVCLATLLKFEIEVVPLKIWSVPEKYSADVVQVLTFIKVTKECILLGLMAHENNSSEALQHFETELMPLVVTNVGIMSCDSALESVRDLKEKCTFTYSGFKVPNACWELDKQIEAFYKIHPWNFLFYNSNIEGSRARASVSIKEKGKIILNGWKKISEIPATPGQDTENNINFNGLCNKDIYSALKSVDWIKNGKFVRIVLEVLAAMEFVPEADAERFSNIELKSQKFDKPLAAMTGGDLKGMELLGKISCFSLVLLHCVIKFRLDGKILQNNPQSLVGILVSHSLQLFEMELLHGLAELAGKYCDFDPSSPLKGVRSLFGNKGLIDSIKAIMGSNKLWFTFPNLPLAASSRNDADMSVVETGFFTFKNMQIKRWSELRMQILSLAKTNKQLRCEAALYCYLVPCYLTALTECGNAEAKGAVFYCRVLVQLLNKVESMLDEGQDKADKSKQVPDTSDVTEALVQLWILQNKLLQMVNAFVDYGSCHVSECFAKIFVNTNWLLHDRRSKNEQLLSACLPNINYLLRHYQSLFWCVVQSVEATTLLFTLKNSFNDLPKEIQRIYKIQQACFQFLIFLQVVCAVTPEAGLSAALKDIIDGLMPHELTAHTWRSAFYYRITTGENLSVGHDKFLQGAKKIFMGLLDHFNCAAQGNEFVHSHFQPISVEIDLACQIDEAAGYKSEWEQCEKFDLHLNGRYPTKPSSPSAAAPAFNGQYQHGRGDEKQVSKAKKFLKPSKEVLGLLEQQKKDKERRVCHMCKKTESGHRQTYITCAECLKSNFPKTKHFCSKICEKKAWETYHEEQHILFDLEMYRPEDDED